MVFTILYLSLFLSFSPLPFPPFALPVPAAVMVLLLPISLPQPFMPPLIMFPVLNSVMILMLVLLSSANIPFQEERNNTCSWTNTDGGLESNA